MNLPRYTVFDHDQRQDIVLLDERKLTLPAGGSAKVTCAAMCCGHRQEAPPGTQPETYRTMPFTSHAGASQAVQYFECAKQLCKDNLFSQMPVNPSQQPSVIAQLAFWSSRREMTRPQLAEIVQRGLKPEGPQQNKEADQGLDNVWNAVDLTKKKAATQ